MRQRLVFLVVLVAAVGWAVSAEAGSGRWKGDGHGGCYWDANDDGPDQCNPDAPSGGRWKVDGQGGCYWDAADNGPNQCEELQRRLEGVQRAVLALNAATADVCDQIDEGDEQAKGICSGALEGGLVVGGLAKAAWIAVGGPVNPYVDAALGAAVAWCEAGHVYELLQVLLNPPDYWINDYSQMDFVSRRWDLIMQLALFWDPMV